jgi:predicted AAA+ superfamily ATPase
LGYFNPEPKTKKEEFFDMEEEVDRLSKGLKHGKLVVVSGLRRYGKTSLILTYLNEEKYDYIYIDCRLLPPGMITLGFYIKTIQRRIGKEDLGEKNSEKC